MLSNYSWISGCAPEIDIVEQFESTVCVGHPVLDTVVTAGNVADRNVGRETAFVYAR